MTITIKTPKIDTSKAKELLNKTSEMAVQSRKSFFKGIGKAISVTSNAVKSVTSTVAEEIKAGM